jgi:hypothetical protein
MTHVVLGGSTPKIRSLADSSTICHVGINHLHHSNHCSNHSIDPHMVHSHLNEWKTTTLPQRHKPTQHHKWWKTCTTLMTVWLSITNQEWTHIPKVWSLCNNIKTYMPICELERESTYDQNGQGLLALLSHLLLKVLLVELLEVLKVVGA